MSGQDKPKGMNENNASGINCMYIIGMYNTVRYIDQICATVRLSKIDAASKTKECRDHFGVLWNLKVEYREVSGDRAFERRDRSHRIPK